ncbi:MAG: glycosyltransferase [Gemmatimonadales bacterium]
MNCDVVLVVPAYNEATRLDGAAFHAFLASDPKARLLFVDDGSTDGTRALLSALAAAEPQGRILVRELPVNMGKAEAVRTGLCQAADSGAAYIGFVDADLSAPLDEVAALCDELDRFPETWAVLGSRVKLLGRDIDRSEGRHYLGRAFATCASLALGLPVYDTQCGLKLFRNGAAIAAALDRPFASRWIFDVELVGRLATAAGADVARRIREVPLERWHERGGSRLRLSDFVRAPLELWQIRRHRG